MEEMEFEQNLRTELGNFDKHPPKDVWLNIQAEINPNKWNRAWTYYGIAASLTILMVAAFGWNWKGSNTLIEGEQLFVTHCQSCHANSENDQMALAETLDQYQETWLMAFTRNSQTLIEANDPIAIKRWNECQSADFHQLEELSNQELKAIYSYISTQ